MRKFTSVLLIIFCAALLVTLTSCSDAGELLTATIQIIGHDRVMLSATQAEFAHGETLLAITKRMARKDGITVLVSGIEMNARIEGFDGMYSGDKGQNSGWVYFVNGEPEMAGCAACEVKAGDRIEWKFADDIYTHYDIDDAHPTGSGGAI